MSIALDMDTTLFIDQSYNESHNYGSGLMRVNINTLSQFKELMSQTRETALENETADLEVKILLHSYKLWYPLILNEENIIVDGFTRAKALIRIIDNDPSREFIVSYITTNVIFGVDEFNNTRGISHAELVAEIKNIRKEHPQIKKTGGLSRIIDQFVEARKFLLIINENPIPQSVVFDGMSEQSHYVGVSERLEEYKQAFVQCAIVYQELGLEQEDVKLSHWIAFFMRVRHDRINLDIAKKNVISARKSKNNPNGYREDRIRIFKEMEDTSKKLHP